MRLNSGQFKSVNADPRTFSPSFLTFNARTKRGPYKKQKDAHWKSPFSLALKEIKIPLLSLSLSYALLFSTRISSRLCAGSFRRERISLNLFFLPSEEEYYIESRWRSTYSRRSNFLCWFPLRSLLSETTEKKIRERKGRFQKGSFPTKKEEKLSKEETNFIPSRMENIGGKTRAQTHFSRSIKRPTTLPLSTRYRDFCVLVLLSTFFLLALLYISQRRLMMMMTTTMEERGSPAYL